MRSAADEIKKLSELREKEIITEEEFQKKKNELLNNTPMQEKTEKIIEEKKKQVPEFKSKNQKIPKPVMIVICAFFGILILIPNISGIPQKTTTNETEKEATKF